MIYSVLYVILAALGLGFLVFIHELGHYFMARRVGMKVEAFSIGFGKPIYTWEHKGVKWQLCWLFFGGYVKIAGMEKKGNQELHDIADGFYGKSPWARIKVALAGPVVNIVFAFLAFTAIWALGGRDKPFSDYTHRIGWVDPQSKLYSLGVRPGDEITSYDNRPFQNFNELLYAALTDHNTSEIAGNKLDYEKGTKEAFHYTLPVYQNPYILEKGFMTIGVMSSAQYLLYNRPPSGEIGAASPIVQSGIQPGDRIVWVDGQLVFSVPQLSAVINEPKALLTIRRGSDLFLARVPRLQVSDLKLGPVERAEIEDWQHEAGLKTKLAQLFFIPYNLSHSCVIQSSLSYLDEQAQEQTFAPGERSPLEVPLQRGDQIVAVDGIPVATATGLLSTLQTRHIQIIVQRQKERPILSWKNADDAFVKQVDWSAIPQLANSIGTSGQQDHVGNLYLLKPVVPKQYDAFPLSEEKKAALAAEMKAIEELEDPKQKALAMRNLEEMQKRFLLGIMPSDQLVAYNPSPFVLFGDVVEDVWRTLKGLFTGSLSPKWLSGPVGIVQVMQHSWGLGIKEALFWLGLISLNLGILNLFPVPVLDGGHICFALFEKITARRLKAKTMEKLVIPFIVLLVFFFIYVTYQDLARLVKGFFS